MIRLVPRWRARIALVAIHALILQAVLSSLVPWADARPDQYDGLSVVICHLADHSPTQDEAPGTPTDHSDAACCILCLIPALDVTNAGIRDAAPDYQSSRSSPLTARVGADPRGATELLPIYPRAAALYLKRHQIGGNQSNLTLSSNSGACCAH
jgi:hypothetical protein